MGMGTWGFLKGASGAGLDILEERRKNEAELAKQERLAALRAEQEKDLTIFKDKLERSSISKDMTEIDYSTGFVIYKDADGNELSRRKLNPSELEAYNVSKQKNELELATKHLQQQKLRQDISLDAVESRERTASYRRSNRGEGGRRSLDSSESTAVDLSTPMGVARAKDLMASELLYKNKGNLPENFQGDPASLAREVVEVWTRRSDEFKKKGVTLDSVWREAVRSYK